MLVALSGIDGSGKGYLTAQLTSRLQVRGYRVASIKVDGWLHLPAKRFGSDDPAGHFYRNAIRFEDMFSQLVLPLRDMGSITVTVDHVEETATAYESRTCELEDIHIILLEGIYLLQAEYARHYDLAVWIECSFETALERAIQRSQEGLAPIDTIRACNTIYFPAQEIHFRVDRPVEIADVIIPNDPRSRVVTAAGSTGGRLNRNVHARAGECHLEP